MIAEHEPPFATPESFKNLECCAMSRKERSEQNIGIENSAGHWRRKVGRLAPFPNHDFRLKLVTSGRDWLLPEAFEFQYPRGRCAGGGGAEGF